MVLSPKMPQVLEAPNSESCDCEARVLDAEIPKLHGELLNVADPGSRGRLWLSRPPSVSDLRIWFLALSMKTSQRESQHLLLIPAQKHPHLKVQDHRAQDNLAQSKAKGNTSKIQTTRLNRRQAAQSPNIIPVTMAPAPYTSGLA